MVLKRRLPARKRPLKKRRMIPRNVNPKIPRTLVANKIHVKRVRFQENWAFSAAAIGGFWRYYTFAVGNNLNTFTDFAPLFDEYRVNALKYTFRPRYDSSQSVDSGTYAQSYAHVLVDPGSTLLPAGTYSAANMNIFLENSGVKTYTLNRPFSIYFRPKISDQLFGGGTTSRMMRTTFIKCTETGVDHRGFHIFLQQNGFSQSNTNIQLDLFITAYVSFKNLR